MIRCERPQGETTKTRHPSAARGRTASLRRAAWVASTACAVALAFSCGPADDAGEGPPESRSEGEVFADALVATFCDGLASCCSKRARTFERASCERSVREVLEGRAPLSENLQFSTTAAGQCLANVRAALPNCAGIELEPCDRIYTGMLAPGTPCERNEECAPVPESSTYCLQVCKAARRAAEGESCVRTCWSDGDCTVLPGEPPAEVMNRTTWGECFTEDGLACVGGRCVRGPSAGAACLENSICDRGSDCSEQTCVARPAIGATCTGDCASGAYCSAAGVCTAQVALGAPCFEESCSVGDCGRDACGAESCPLTCQSPTLGASHGATAECNGMVHL